MIKKYYESCLCGISLPNYFVYRRTPIPSLINLPRTSTSKLKLIPDCGLFKIRLVNFNLYNTYADELFLPNMAIPRTIRFGIQS